MASMCATAVRGIRSGYRVGFQDAKFYLLIHVCIYCSLPKEHSSCQRRVKVYFNEHPP